MKAQHSRDDAVVAFNLILYLRLTPVVPAAPSRNPGIMALHHLLRAVSLINIHESALQGFRFLRSGFSYITD